jgi:hypothetical protein
MDVKGPEPFLERDEVDVPPVVLQLVRPCREMEPVDDPGVVRLELDEPDPRS